MASHTKVVSLRGTLRSEDGRYQRECRIRAMKVTMQVDELMSSAAVEYPDVSIVDSDDFPDGNYELTFDGQKDLRTKKNGQYLARQ